MGNFLAQFSIRVKIFGLIALGVLACLIIGTVGVRSTSDMNDLTVDMHDNLLMSVYCGRGQPKRDLHQPR